MARKKTNLGSRVNPKNLEEQLKEHRRKVDFDTFDILLQQLLQQVEDGTIDVAPAYQRQYRWGDVRASQLIESLFLGIPVPSLFMAADDDGTWELVDGLQRLTAVAKFAGSPKLQEKMGLEALRLSGLEKLESYNDCTFGELPPALRLQFLRRSLKVVTLSDKSDRIVRFDLFERLNRGGIDLSPQEIRQCVFRGEFADHLEKMSANKNFRKVLRLNREQERDATREECVLRFYAYLHRYKSFDHLVGEFLNKYMEAASKNFNFVEGREIFEETFDLLADVFPNGLRRAGRQSGSTSLVLYDAVVVGAALAVQKTHMLKGTRNTKKWLSHSDLHRHTTGATNNRPAVKFRIEFCRDRFLGIPSPPVAND
ncbi:MAG: DUF262 domain-containing protein [Bythopirellula sp.]|nr:DUF262 domain-containing protein [Bythopirellula sp.]